MGIAVIGAVVGASSTSTFGPGFAHATHAGWWLIVGLGVIMLGVGAVTTTKWAQATAAATAAQLKAPAAPIAAPTVSREPSSTAA